MIKIIREPGSGKTKEIMQHCFDENATFICRNPEAMAVKARAYGFFGLKIASYSDFILDSDYNENNAYFDDIDEFLEIIGCRVKGFGGNK